MSRLPREVSDALGEALAYPREGYRRGLEACRHHLAAAVDGEAARELAAFLAESGEWDPARAEELYTRAFDLDPVATLEVGWHLYGEQYERGRFLVRCRELLRRTGVAEGGELPDHLMLLLPALGRLEPGEAAALAGRYLAPAVERMLQGLAGRHNPYRPLLAAVGRVLAAVAAAGEPAAAGAEAPGWEAPGLHKPDWPAAPAPGPEPDLVQIGRPARSRTLPGDRP